VARADATEVSGRGRRLPAVPIHTGLGVLIVIVAAALLAFRAPHAFHGFRNGERAAAGRNGLNGALAGADSLAIDDGFVLAAVQTLPDRARYKLLLPPSLEIAQKTYGIDPLTLDALPPFMREVLLPRLPVDEPARNDYVLCYDCDTSPWDSRTRWLWTDKAGHAIGRVYR
jgi:hypothetical protein